MPVRPFRKVMAANRGEIAIRIFRACTELGIRTVAIYSEEDRLSLHRYKADEAYLVGKGKTPIDAYLGIDEIVALARRRRGRRHPPRLRLPGRERRLRRRLREGRHRLHRPHRRDDAQPGRQGGRAARPPSPPASRWCPGTPEPIVHDEEALIFARQHGYPIIVKAPAGGGGRGMRVARNQKELLEGLVSAAQRGPGRLRQRRGLPGALRREPQAHRGPGAGRPPRQPGPLLRARLLGAAPPPEGGRVRPLAGARPRRSGPRSATTPSGSPARSATATPAPSSSCSTGRGATTSSR